MEKMVDNTNKKYHCKWYVKFLGKFIKKIKKYWYQYIEMPYLKSQLGSCGNNVVICERAYFNGKANILFADDIYLGPGAVIYSSGAKVHFGNHVFSGPKLTIISGDHRIRLIGRYMKEISDDERLPEDDQDVIIEDDVWLGANVSIFKGVRIGTGSVIAGAATVVKDVPPYSVYISKEKIIPRFTEEQLSEHKRLLNQKVTIQNDKK